MKGNNRIILNHASMVEALQLWADRTLKAPVIIKDVMAKGSEDIQGFYEIEIAEVVKVSNKHGNAYTGGSRNVNP